ncbi:MAG: methionyl-tRNA formyltransferase [Patescibacteria group bacterium]
MKIVFFGTPELATNVLQALIDAEGFDVVATVTRPDKAVGRDPAITPSPVKALATGRGIPVLDFASLKTAVAVDALRTLNADVFVVFNYGKIIPPAVLEIPPLGCVNLHPSLLPKYRGPTPYLSALLNGETETGVSIMLLDAGMDTGPILATTRVPIMPDDTTPELAERLIAAGTPVLIATLRGYAAGTIQPVAQNDAEATYTKLLDREDGLVTGKETPEELDRKIRAYTPWPGCYTIIKRNGKDLRVKLLPGGMVQPEGKKPMALSEFERGYGQLFS